LGSGNIIYPFACLGFAPQHARFDPDTPGKGTIIGDENTFREHSTIHRAYEAGHPTQIGNNNLFMVNSHAGHDCVIANNCTFVNNSALGGHVYVSDRVTIGGGTVVHQFCRIGRGAMLSGAVGLSRDLPPWFMLTANNVCGSLNLIGMRRSGMAREDIDIVKWVYRTLYREGYTINDAVSELKSRSGQQLVDEYIAFVESSDRGICEARGRTVRGTA
jgi:UDP-N-acetylglucosamine acyltransferase